MYSQTRGGTRGGAAEFKWSDVGADKDRENYLGHSINAPTGRWQKNKDVHWYNRDLKQSELERLEEIRKIKEAEEDALAAALGFKPVDRTAEPSTSQQAESAEEKAKEKEAKRQRKEEKRRRKEERRERREHRNQERSRSRSRGIDRGRHDGTPKYRSRSVDSGSRSPLRHQRQTLYRERGVRSDSRSRSPLRSHDAREDDNAERRRNDRFRDDGIRHRDDREYRRRY